MAAVRVFRLSGGSWSVVVGRGKQGARVEVLGYFRSYEEAMASAKSVRGGKVVAFR